MLFGIVSLPVVFANPAEFVLAVTTGHMVAAVVLLDAYITLRATFSS
jgi:hypothetical protein